MLLSCLPSCLAQPCCLEFTEQSMPELRQTTFSCRLQHWKRALDKIRIKWINTGFAEVAVTACDLPIHLNIGKVWEYSADLTEGERG